MNQSEAMERFKATLRSPMLQMNLLAAITGTCAAVLTWIFISMSNGIQGIFYGDSFIQNSLVGTENEWQIIFIPALGGLIAGLIIEYWSKDAKGAGVPLVMEAVTFKQARLSAKKAIAKCFAAATCIGTGMSLGRVGPMVVISSTVGSEIGQRTGKTVDETRTLVGCGAASAITAAFNAPLGGVLFAIELILAELRTRSFIPIVVAAVIATTVGRGLTGDVAAFDSIPKYTLSSPSEYPFYIILGLITGFAAAAFIKLLNLVETNIEKMDMIPVPLRTCLGGLCVGMIALSFPHVLGNGFDVTSDLISLDSDESGSLILGNSFLDINMVPGVTSLLLFVISIMLLKIIATSISIGSGGSGGIFTPSLFIGAALGAALGLVLNDMEIVDHPGAFALVGMAAFVASTTRATLTAIVLLFEMTATYEIILPLMLSCVVADAVCYVLSEHSCYTSKLARRGINIDLGAEQDLMRMIKVEDAMTEEVMTITPERPLEVALQMIEDTGHMSLPVVNDKNELIGIITWADIHIAALRHERHLTVGDYCVTDLITVTPRENLTQALDSLGYREISHLPVVDKSNRLKLLGIITKGDIIKAYNRQRFLRKQMSWQEEF
uniref:Cl-channel voltage-gated family protein (TC.CIC) n=1 Tax=uncultured marine group II/III euryarchaeote AD1000_39_C04 TaxID=1457762 RepID=A0A075FVS8_9EURY|nr:Cl- channel voltage-gated family protein (TC.CIC) [uncultured marine group II/III euryarchaeote AD1000_39_C04]